MKQLKESQNREYRKKETLELFVEFKLFFYRNRNIADWDNLYEDFTCKGNLRYVLRLF